MIYSSLTKLPSSLIHSRELSFPRWPHHLKEQRQYHWYSSAFSSGGKPPFSALSGDGAYGGFSDRNGFVNIRCRCQVRGKRCKRLNNCSGLDSHTFIDEICQIVCTPRAVRDQTVRCGCLSLRNEAPVTIMNALGNSNEHITFLRVLVHHQKQFISKPFPEDRSGRAFSLAEARTEAAASQP